VRARKSELLAGELDGAPVIAKRLVRPNPVWAWYLAREIELYRAFDATPPPIRVPRLIAADDEVLVIERLEGAPLAKLRRPYAELAPEVVEELIAMHDALATWPGAFPALQPTTAVRSQLRTRLLEDPTSPIEWVRAGLARCGAKSILDSSTVRDALAALDAHSPIAPSHGDLLLRNVIGAEGGGQGVGLVDWECAGLHVADWDLALLWTQLAPDARSSIEQAIGDGPRLRTFWALAVFALAREVTFLHAFRVPPYHKSMRRVVEELARARARLA
jgi:Ser/Thr protein kinase RdoA (MazF antagonist)